MRHTRMWFPTVAAVLATALGAGALQAAGLLIANNGFGGVLEIVEHDVKVTLNNGVAVTEVTQVFRNLEDRPVEALYTFPVPKGASVANFSMWINGKEMIGEVVEKQRARQIYESYKPKRIDPGLLEQTDYKTFEMRIFPIGPRADQKVRIRYYQELDFDHDWATYVYPLASVTRPGVDSKVKGRFSLTVEVKSEVPLVSMESPSHGDELVVAKHDASYWRASLESARGELNKDIVLAYQVSRARTGFDLIASRQPGEDGYFCLILTAGKELEEVNADMDYVFILDISGSMGHDGKLVLSRNMIGAFIESLDEADRFEVITFNVAPAPLFGKLSRAGEAAKGRAVEFLATRTARGGTELRPALGAAYRYAGTDRTLNVVVLSDGMTDQGDRQALLESIRSRPSGVRVFCIGVGNEVNRPLLKQLAEDTGGLSAFLSRGDDFHRQAKAFRRKLMHPAAGNVRIEFAGGDVHDVEPVKLPNLYHGTPVRLYGRYRRGGTTKVTFRAEVNGREVSQSMEMSFPKTDAGNPEIERIWAWRRARRLLDEADRSGSRRQVIAEVVRLGEAYSIATEYTSFLVLENDAEYRRWRIERRNALRIRRDRGARKRLETQLASMRRKTADRIGPAMAEPVLAAPALAEPRQPAPAQTPPPHPSTPSQRWNLRLPLGGGGGPVGPAVLVLVAGLILVQRGRRQSGRRQSRQ